MSDFDIATTHTLNKRCRVYWTKYACYECEPCEIYFLIKPFGVEKIWADRRGARAMGEAASGLRPRPA